MSTGLMERRIYIDGGLSYSYRLRRTPNSIGCESDRISPLDHLFFAIDVQAVSFRRSVNEAHGLSPRRSELRGGSAT
jgi:hypothetical protein